MVLFGIFLLAKKATFDRFLFILTWEDIHIPKFNIFLRVAISSVWVFRAISLVLFADAKGIADKCRLLSISKVIKV